MSNLDITYNAIDSNEEFQKNPELRKVVNILKETIDKFHKCFPEISLDNFNERIKTLHIERSKYGVRASKTFHFIELDNKISMPAEIYDEQEFKDEVTKNQFIHEVIAIISSKPGFFHHGFNIDNNNELRALNIGVTQLIVNTLFGTPTKEDEDEDMTVEQALALTKEALESKFKNTRAQICKDYADKVFQGLGLTADEVLEAYFTNNPTIINEKIDANINKTGIRNNIREMGNSCWNNNLSEMEEQFNRISIFFPVTRKQNDIETLEEETVKKI